MQIIDGLRWDIRLKVWTKWEDVIFFYTPTTSTRPISQNGYQSPLVVGVYLRWSNTSNQVFHIPYSPRTWPTTVLKWWQRQRRGFDGKPQLYIYIYIYGPRTRLLRFSSVLHHLMWDIRVWKSQNLQQNSEYNNSNTNARR